MSPDFSIPSRNMRPFFKIYCSWKMCVINGEMPSQMVTFELKFKDLLFSATLEDHLRSPKPYRAPSLLPIIFDYGGDGYPIGCSIDVILSRLPCELTKAVVLAAGMREHS